MSGNNPQNQENNQNNQQIQIKMDDAKIAGSYANQIFVTNTPEEFILDFMSLLPNSPMGQLIQRIILNPEHARRFNNILTEQLKRYDNKELPAAAPMETTPNRMGFKTE
ncbi:DUF3467 domain-containing protein [bacterium]|nr:MAG: DUF3467 domain-containing protein [bacterium]